MARILLTLSALAWIPLVLALESGTAAPEHARAMYAQGIALFQSGRFDEAVTQLRGAVELVPDNAEYHDALGRAYGRAAERAGWLRAVALAVKTRREFETAVRLDGDNVKALQDLMNYYRQAPAILGGSDRKADTIEHRLNELSGTPAATGLDDGASSTLTSLNPGLRASP